MRDVFEARVLRLRLIGRLEPGARPGKQPTSYSLCQVRRGPQREGVSEFTTFSWHLPPIFELQSWR